MAARPGARHRRSSPTSASTAIHRRENTAQRDVFFAPKTKRSLCAHLIAVAASVAHPLPGRPGLVRRDRLRCQRVHSRPQPRHHRLQHQTTQVNPRIEAGIATRHRCNPMAHGVRRGDVMGLLLIRRQIIQLAVGLGGIEVKGEGELPVVDPDGGFGRVKLVLCGTRAPSQ